MHLLFYKFWFSFVGFLKAAYICKGNWLSSLSSRKNFPIYLSFISTMAHIPSHCSTGSQTWLYIGTTWRVLKNVLMPELYSQEMRFNWIWMCLGSFKSIGMQQNLRTMNLQVTTMEKTNKQTLFLWAKV